MPEIFRQRKPSRRRYNVYSNQLFPWRCDDRRTRPTPFFCASVRYRRKFRQSLLTQTPPVDVDEQLARAFGTLGALPPHPVLKLTIVPHQVAVTFWPLGVRGSDADAYRAKRYTAEETM